MQYILISPSSSESSSLRNSTVAILARSIIASNSCKYQKLYSKSTLNHYNSKYRRSIRKAKTGSSSTKLQNILKIINKIMAKGKIVFMLFIIIKMWQDFIKTLCFELKRLNK
jgi:hypothetical protein